MANIIDKIRSKGEELSSLRTEINAAEEVFESQMKEKKELRDKVQEELLELLRANDLASIKTSSGDNFIRSKRKGFSYDEFRLLPWAIENHAIKIDSTILKQKFTKMADLPAGVSVVEQEYISVRKAKTQVVEGEMPTEE